MGLFDILGKKNGSNPVEDLDEEAVKRQNRAQTSQYCDYIKSNFARVSKLLSDLKNDTQELVSQISAKKGVKMSFREKGDLRKVKDKANKNLQYLYLSRDFFTALAKNASGILLQSEELTLVTKFAPYFDGVPVLDVEDDADESVLGAFKEVGRELRSAFISSPKASKHFDFEDYMCRYEEQLDEFVMPDIDSAIASFRNVTSSPEVASTATQQTKKVVCPCCGANLANADTLGECEYCGTPLR